MSFAIKRREMRKQIQAREPLSDSDDESRPPHEEYGRDGRSIEPSAEVTVRKKKRRLDPNNELDLPEIAARRQQQAMLGRLPRKKTKFQDLSDSDHGETLAEKATKRMKEQRKVKSEPKQKKEPVSEVKKENKPKSSEADHKTDHKTDQKSRKYKCKRCDQEFDNSINFRNHRTSHAINPRLFKCRKCDKAYTRRTALVYHESSIHSNGIEGSDRVFHCIGHKCRLTFTTRSERDDHAEEAHGVPKKPLSETSIYHNKSKQIPCKMCDKTFSFARDHIRHMRTHNDERPFKCNVCDKAFKQKAHLTTHMRTHTGERPFKCTECPASFIQQHSLTVHMRTHTGEKPFECDYCEKHFGSTAILKTHIFMMHGRLNNIA